MEDIIQLLIYAVIILAGVVASAVQAKKKAPPAGGKQVPGGQDQGYDNLPEDPFEQFDFPNRSPLPQDYETAYESVETGPTVEAGGQDVERIPGYGGFGDDPPDQKEVVIYREEGTPAFATNSTEEDGHQLGEDIYAGEDSGYDPDAITAGEIVSEEESIRREAATKSTQSRFDIRQAIIYSEILKRKEI